MTSLVWGNSEPSCIFSNGNTTQKAHSGVTKISETWIQIERYVEMMVLLPFGNPWGYRFRRAFGNSIQITREVDQ